jgi:hypothetical protein
MTYLQEFIACTLRVPVGRYFVMTNNLHIYHHHWHLLDNPQVYDYYDDTDKVEPYPILADTEDPTDFLYECEKFMEDPHWPVRSKWLKHVVQPMYEHYVCRLNGDRTSYDIEENRASDWRTAEYLWREWHDSRD